MSQYLDWKVGDRIVCIASQEKIDLMTMQNPGSAYPASQGIYTIREIRDDAQWNKGRSSIVVLLNEVDNRHFIGTGRDGWFCYVEPGFPVTGFRKVEPKKTDISIFTAMLHGVSDEVSA